VKRVAASSAVTSATLLIIVAGATVFGEYLTFGQIPGKIATIVVNNISITGAAVDRDIVYVIRAVLPFLAIQLAILFLLTFWPDLVLLLPRLVYG
jgi:TRAP-type C4-dicarboxylate transport system permease large subunit